MAPAIAASAARYRRDVVPPCYLWGGGGRRGEELEWDFVVFPFLPTPGFLKVISLVGTISFFVPMFSSSK